jgi:hypothetical protein
MDWDITQVTQMARLKAEWLYAVTMKIVNASFRAIDERP